MRSTVLNWKSFLVVIVALSLIGAISCGSAEEEPADAAAPAPASAAAAADSSAPVAAPAPAAPAPGAPPAGFQVTRETYKPAALNQKGTAQTLVWDGPAPTKLYENPRLTALVKEGKLPPLEDRIPDMQDIQVFAAPDEIGVYGGIGRIFSHEQNTWINAELNGSGTCIRRDGDDTTPIPNTCKGFKVNEDSTVYTFFLRKGLRWSDGEPLTMDDVKFAWEDLNFNEEMNAKVAQAYKDPVTGEPVKFAVVDDWTFTLSFDTPNVDAHVSRVGHSCAKGYGFGCHAMPKQFLKAYHPKYAEKAKLDAMIKEGGHENWTQLFKANYNRRFSADVPTTGHFYLCEATGSGTAGGRTVMCANPYYHGFDPAGNQLPYLDGYEFNVMESREVAVLRGMNGEVDGPYSGMMYPEELPVYIENMEKGDFSLYHWPDFSGNDAGVIFNMEHNSDPEIGKWIRTKEFRNALSISLDRNRLNELIFLGVGVPQAWVPHPTTPYYPGDKYMKMNATNDVEQAKAMLAALGLKDTDGDGLLNREDGAGNIELNLAYHRANFYPVMETLQDDWAKIGIKLILETGRNPFRGSATDKTKEHMFMRSMPQMFLLWGWNQMMPYYSGFVGGIGMGTYFETGGESGMAPIGETKVACDVCSDKPYLPLAPVGNYPTDPDGKLMRMQEAYTEGLAYSTFDPRRIELGKELFRTNVEQNYVLGTVGFVGNVNGIVLKRNNLRNVNRQSVSSKYGKFAQLYYFEDGIDNVNHPGNRSKKYKSENDVLK